MMLHDQKEACICRRAPWAMGQRSSSISGSQYAADVQRGVAELCCFPGLHEHPSPRSIADRCGGIQEESEQEAGAGAPSLSRLLRVSTTYTISAQGCLMLSWLLQVFFDLELEGGSITELCIKEGPAFSVARVKDLRDYVKLGDTVLVTGTTDPGDPHVILPSGISVTTRWKDAHPGKHFLPKCRPKQPLQSEAQKLLTEVRGEPDGPAELVKRASGRREDSHAAAVKHEPSSSQQVIGNYTLANHSTILHCAPRFNCCFVCRGSSLLGHADSLQGLQH